MHTKTNAGFANNTTISRPIRELIKNTTTISKPIRKLVNLDTSPWPTLFYIFFGVKNLGPETFRLTFRGGPCSTARTL